MASFHNPSYTDLLRLAQRHVVALAVVDNRIVHGRAYNVPTMARSNRQSDRARVALSACRKTHAAAHNPFD